ncbi:hypothetical protein, partial [Bacillus sp. SRB_331]|uniref:hypothetical protein n=1 Tax=Bacillus sp. SRB_331 TaxID=1969379 RepID=UPI001C65CE1F
LPKTCQYHKSLQSNLILLFTSKFSFLTSSSFPQSDQVPLLPAKTNNMFYNLEFENITSSTSSVRKNSQALPI